MTVIIIIIIDHFGWFFFDFYSLLAMSQPVVLSRLLECYFIFLIIYQLKTVTKARQILQTSLR
jgi:hypothetical protein